MNSEHMQILFIGDIFGSPGRKIVRDHLGHVVETNKVDLVIANAAAGFVVAGLANEMNAGIALAREEIDSGRALEKLKALQNYSV